MSLLAVEDLALGYDNRVIVKDLNFRVNAGDYLCIVGENGSGKTTLMRTLLGLQAPAGGRIVRRDSLESGQIGYLPQQTQVQKDFPASVWEIVLSGCVGRLGRRAFYSGADRALAKQNLERMGIADLADHCYRDLSGGQQQRVLLARALCAAEKLLLLDEPVTGLDPGAADAMYELIGDLSREGVTIIMITHDLTAVKAYASHVLHIGKEIFFGTKEDYLDTQEAQIFLRRKGGEE